MRKRPVVFLDRDGTILNERRYLRDFKRLIIYPSAIKGLRRLQKNGFALVIVTNQSGVGRGYFSLAALKLVNRAFARKLQSEGIKLAGIYYCPHRPEAGCKCRKPKPGLGIKAKNLPQKYNMLILEHVRQEKNKRKTRD